MRLWCVLGIHAWERPVWVDNLAGWSRTCRWCHKVVHVLPPTDMRRLRQTGATVAAGTSRHSSRPYDSFHEQS